MSGRVVAAAGVPDGFASRWRTVDGLRLHALESAGGAAPGVVLLPGLVTASRSMVPLARALGRQGIGTSLLDPAGFGYSDKPRRVLSVSEQASLVTGWLTATGRWPARLLGNSFGTQLAAAVAAGQPGAVSRLVLLSPTVAPQMRRWTEWLRVLPAPRRSPGGPAGRWRAELLSRLHGALGDAPPLRVLNVAEYGCAGLPRATGTLRDAVTHPIERVLPRVGAPVLVVRADNDDLSSLEWAERLAALPPEGRLTRLPGVGHDAFYRLPDKVAAVAGPFLRAADDSGEREW
jgi:pimeloyl-ACP methyl ester carboxylesterase